jgi:hypothetical protein
MNREYYSDEIIRFLNNPHNEILGTLAKNNEFPLELTQRDAWNAEITILKKCLKKFNGKIFFEYSIPRMGKRIDVLVIIKSVIFVLEFKVGEKDFPLSAIDQVWDYALDLKNFHEKSHDAIIAPILISTNSMESFFSIEVESDNDQVLVPILCNSFNLQAVIDKVLLWSESNALINIDDWLTARYHPTPTIIEAATALYRGHDVKDISRKDASAKNLQDTTEVLSQIIKESKYKNQKSICFVTGVPGAGKTLVGLNIAATNMNKKAELYSVFLSGNGPLVAVLQEALARDKVLMNKRIGKIITKSKASMEVKAFIQNVHNFRDEAIIDKVNPPIEHVVLFDEAQRAWTKEQTAFFMLRKKHIPDFKFSEPEFLISYMDRHLDWAVIVCLVGGGQEINTGEAGISEWISSINRTFHNWQVFISSKLTDSEYGAGQILTQISPKIEVKYIDDLHLSVSMRSFRSEKVSLLIKNLLDLKLIEARNTLKEINKRYPIVLTRDLRKAKNWLKEHARGTERYGMMVSSQAYRLKPLAIDIRPAINPVHWFLNDKLDVRSSYYLEDVATEFQIQGLEVDWSCVIWDGDFRLTPNGWDEFSFVGSKWNKIQMQERKNYLKNAYRVLLTRARQGMVIVVPEGNPEDPTRKFEYYDPVFSYLSEIGFKVI